MTKLDTLKQWKYHYFESSCCRTEEYARFESTLKRWYKRLCANNGWELVRYTPTHFECGCYIRGKNGRMINILGNDVRNTNYPYHLNYGWWKVCYRYVKDEKDYHGETNCWATFDEIEERLQEKLN